jgi:hypothetical protein
MMMRIFGKEGSLGSPQMTFACPIQTKGLPEFLAFGINA